MHVTIQEVRDSTGNTFPGLKGLAERLQVDIKTGLTGHDFVKRTEHFGNNESDPLVAKTFCSLFLGALDDFMLKVLMVASVFSIVLDMSLASPEARGHGK